MEYRRSLLDCVLELEWVKLIKRDRPARSRRATPDDMLPLHTYPFMLGREWGDDSKCQAEPNGIKPAHSLLPIKISECQEVDDGISLLVQAYASFMVDPKSNAREFHKIYFTKDQWDALACVVRTYDKVILEGCTICFDDEDEEVVVDTAKYYDDANGEGFSTGISHRYIPGVVVEVQAIEIARRLKMPGDASQPELPDGLVLSTYGEKIEDIYPSRDPCLDDDGHDDYEPKLSDFYDDLEELELNTRGDGFD